MWGWDLAMKRSYTLTFLGVKSRADGKHFIEARNYLDLLQQNDLKGRFSFRRKGMNL